MKQTKKQKRTYKVHELIRNLSSDEYHGMEGTYSSSQLKDIIDDEQVFIQKYIKKEAAKLEGEALDTGTYFHTGLLERGKLETDIAVFMGKARYGRVWDTFREIHKGKTVITAKQKQQGDGMIAAVKASPISMEYLQGEPEVSLFVELLVSNGHIFAPHFSKVLTQEGWQVENHMPLKGYTVTVKVRADCLGDSFISDLKSTSGRANQKDSVRHSISKYKYDLSAAFYLDMFSLIKEDLNAFIWIFASKENPIAASWLASDKQIKVGRAKWSWAIKRLADMSRANWEQIDYLRTVDPLVHENEWLVEKDVDLL